MQGWLNPILRLVFPAVCQACGIRGEWWCSECDQAVLRISWPGCPACQKRTPSGQYCTNCRQGVSLTGIVAGARFHGPLLAGIKALKYRHATVLAPSLASYPIEPLRKVPGLNKGKLVPVPLHQTRLRRRGHNQARLLADSISQQTGLPVADNLARLRNTPSQTGLHRLERHQNVQAAFGWQGSALNGQTVLLIDDVVTTGATLNACAKACRMAGARQVWGVVIAQR